MFRFLLFVLFAVLGLVFNSEVGPECYSKCPDPGTPSQPPKEKTFVLNYLTKVNWFQAMEQCHVLNMKFATINDQPEYYKMLDLINKANIGPGSFWISGSDLGVNKTYLWASYGTPMLYTNWSSGEPNHFSHAGLVEHCIELNSIFDYRMNDERCTFEKYYICEY